MKEKTVSKISFLSNALVFLTAGIILIVTPTTSLTVFRFVVCISLISLGFISLVFNIIKYKKFNDILASLGIAIIGIFFLNNSKYFLSFFSILFGLYMLINCIFKLVAYFLHKSEGLKIWSGLFIGGVMDLVFATILFLNPSINVRYVALLVGIYLVLFSFSYFKDFLKEQYPNKFNKGGITITLPTFLLVMIPYRVLIKINNFLDRHVTPVKIDTKKTSGHVDLEIIIHISDGGNGRFGHIDFCIDDTVYSYGAYDGESKKAFESIGEGVLLKVKGKESYLNFCADYSEKAFFVYGITLTEKQKKALDKEVKKIEGYTYKWDYNDSPKNRYVNHLGRKTNAEVFKFKESNYRLYFLFFTNCVKLVDDVLRATGGDILRINGVMTPGTYYNYLDKEFRRNNSNVITKDIYRQKVKKKKK